MKRGAKRGVGRGATAAKFFVPARQMGIVEWLVFRWRLRGVDVTVLPRVESEHSSVLMRVASIYDGDTFTAVITVRGGRLRRRRCRCVGYDSPELRNPDTKVAALAARAFLEERLPTGVFRADTHGLDKYGRLLVDVRVRGERLADMMIRSGHGYAYDGGTKSPPPAVTKKGRTCDL